MKPILGLGALGLILTIWMVWRLALLDDNARALVAGLVPEFGMPPNERQVSGQSLPPLYAQEDGRDRHVSPSRSPAKATFPILVAEQEASAPEDPTQDLGKPSPPLPPRSPDPSRAAPLEPARDDAFHLAASAFEKLRHNDRRAAAAGFQEALSLRPQHPSAPVWREQLHFLNKRLDLSAYWLARGTVTQAIGQPQPVFGGSQYGAGLSWMFDPLASRPVSAELRLTGAPSQQGMAGAHEAAIGLAWQPFGHNTPKFVLERRIALDEGGRNVSQFRISGGAATPSDQAVDLSAYADAGFAGVRSRDLFAGGQAFAGYRVRDRLSVGGGLWGGIQRADDTLSQLEAGPELRATVPFGDAALDIRASYRLRIAGNAGRNDGAALTVAVRY